MVVPELRPWRAAGPRVTRLANAVRPRLTRAADALRPRLARATRPKTWQYTACAATAGLALAATVVTAVGPWDSTGQRTAERDRAAARERTGGTDHGRDAAPPGARDKGPRPAPSAGAVLTALGAGAGHAGSVPDGKALATVLGPLLDAPGLGRRTGAAVVDVATGRRLYGEGASEALTPASTTKIATAVAALTAMGPDHRLTTRTVLEPDTKELVLVGGGDPTLTAREKTGGWAGLRDLAARTAGALKQRGLRKVTLSYDTTLYAGSERHVIGKNSNLAPVSALMADEGRLDDSSSGTADRSDDPAKDTAERFAGLLADHGVRAGAPGPSKATNRAESLAQVTSPPLTALVERMLTNSDNDIAEALARHTALASGERPDFAGGGKAIAARLGKLGLPVSGVTFRDGSGLDRRDALTADLLTALLAHAADPAHPELRAALTGLPVAGFTGTLTSRYADGAAGVVRAKTGTLTGVNTLAGTAVDQDGRLLAFAFLASDTTDRDAAQSALDRAATALASCGCR
ncbi:D-alanyl-D-alanine carboxypeptidase/D-alanyl-D-alanine endopeptidase [Streptomyces sp. NPDC003514]